MEGGTWNTVMGALLALAVFFVLFFIFTKGVEYVRTGVDPQAEKLQREGCLNSGITAFSPVFDCDGDCLPDNCDRCLGGDDAVDLNDNGFGDACETGTAGRATFRKRCEGPSGTSGKVREGNVEQCVLSEAAVKAADAGLWELMQKCSPSVISDSPKCRQRIVARVG